jgi:hypothetical protein
MRALDWPCSNATQVEEAKEHAERGSGGCGPPDWVDCTSRLTSGPLPSSCPPLVLPPVSVAHHRSCLPNPSRSSSSLCNLYTPSLCSIRLYAVSLLACSPSLFARWCYPCACEPLFVLPPAAPPVPAYAPPGACQYTACTHKHTVYPASALFASANALTNTLSAPASVLHSQVHPPHAFAPTSVSATNLQAYLLCACERTLRVPSALASVSSLHARTPAFRVSASTPSMRLQAHPPCTCRHTPRLRPSRPCVSTP